MEECWWEEHAARKSVKPIAYNNENKGRKESTWKIYDLMEE